MQKELFRFMTCGNVDDGKSTLIARLLYETNMLGDEDKEYFKNNPDYIANIMDGLSIEQEQNITIDVAYKFFDTAKRRYIISDCPGHIQYTYNTISAMSLADAAILLIDATKDIQEQSISHLNYLKILKIKNIIVAFNKIDLVDFNDEIFLRLKNEILSLTDNTNNLFFIPISALKNINIIKTNNSDNFYKGKSLLELLEDIEICKEKVEVFEIRNVIKNKKRNYKIISSDSLLNKELYKNNKKITLMNCYSDSCIQTISLSEDLDLKSSDILTSKEIKETYTLKCKIIWFNKKINNLKLKRSLFNTNILNINIKESNHYFDTCYIQLKDKIQLISFEDNRFFGSFILIDENNNTIGCGLIDKELNSNFNYSPILFTGLSGSGKTTLSTKLKKELEVKTNKKVIILDADDLRNGINSDLGFNNEDRIENNRRIAYIAKLLIDNDVIPIISVIAPTNEIRNNYLDILSKHNLKIIFLNKRIENCIKEDVKGLYKIAKDDKLKNFTGLDSKFEIPDKYDLELKTDEISIDQSIEKILSIID